MCKITYITIPSINICIKIMNISKIISVTYCVIFRLILIANFKITFKFFVKTTKTDSEFANLSYLYVILNKKYHAYARERRTNNGKEKI